MPAAPPWARLKPFWARPIGSPLTAPPRWQATILPVNVPAGAGCPQKMSLYGAAEASTTGSGPAPAVIDAPTNVAEAPSLDVTVRVESNSRFCVEAATVVTHGDKWSLDDAAGPGLPAEAATNAPAPDAARDASATTSCDGVAARLI